MPKICPCVTCGKSYDEGRKDERQHLTELLSVLPSDILEQVERVWESND